MENGFAEGYAVGRDNSNNNNGYGFGGMWGEWIWIIVLFALWQNGGFGFGGGNGGVGANYVLATDFATIERKLDGVNAGICDSTFALNNTINNGFFGVQNSLTQGFAGINNVLSNGFAGVDRAVCTLGYQNQAGVNQISNLIQSCCCDLKQLNLENRYLNERQTCDLITNQNANTRAILDYLSSEKISALQAENAGLKAQISNDKQSAYIVNALSPKCPQPAYVVQPPQEVTFPTNCCGTVNYANFNNGCGCGCN